MTRCLYLLLLLPLDMAVAHDVSFCDPLNPSSDKLPNPTAVYHQIPEKIDRLKLYRDEIKLIQLELDGLYDQKKFADKNVALNENIKALKHRTSQLGEIMAESEEWLRVNYRQLSKQISTFRYCTPVKINQESYLKSIEAYLNIPEYKRLYIDHNDYGRYFFKLNVGYEYNSISGILKESSPRIGLLIYSHFGRMAYQNEYGFGHYGYQLFANVILSGNTASQDATAPVTEDDQIEDTLGINVAIYKPILRTPIRPDVSHLFGPMINIGSKQNDQTTEIQREYYIGVRSAMTPEHYIDVLYGRSPGQDSRRLQIRGQMPVATLGGGSRFFVGLEANLAVANKQENETDVFTVYVSWNIDFLDLFTTGG